MAHGIVRKQHGVWHYVVWSKQGHIMACDDSGTHPQMLQACIRDVAAFTRIERLGYTIPDTWADLVDQQVI